MTVTPSSVLNPSLLSPQALEDPVVCHCAKVKLSGIREVLGEASSLQDVSEKTGAGTGCTACHCRIQRVLAGLPPHCTPFGAGVMGIKPCRMCGSSGGECACQAGEHGRCAP